MKDLFEKIVEEHEEIKEMISELASGEEGDIFEEFKTELKAHIEAEEKTLYEAMKRDVNGKELALVGIEEHRIGTEVLNRMDKSESKFGEEWKVQANVLKHLLEKHIEVEEEEVIPMAKDMLDKKTVEELGEQFESLEEELEH
jgi:hemerythrin-like domain-containing protein